MSFEDFLFLAQVAILFNAVEPSCPSWISDQHNFSSFGSTSHPVATEQVSAQSNQRFLKRCRKLIIKMAAVAAILDFLLTHLAILCLLGTLMPSSSFDSTGLQRGFQNMNSQHCFPYRCIGPIQMHGEANLTLL